MKKYAGGYLNHFLAMYSIHFRTDDNKPELTLGNLEEMISMYKQFEGEEEYQALRKEIKEVQSNNDWAAFADQELNQFETAAQVQQIGELVLNYQD